MGDLKIELLFLVIEEISGCGSATSSRCFLDASPHRFSRCVPPGGDTAEDPRVARRTTHAAWKCIEIPQNLWPEILRLQKSQATQQNVVFYILVIKCRILHSMATTERCHCVDECLGQHI